VSDRARKSNAAMIIGHGHNAPRIFGGRIPAVARFVGPKERIRFFGRRMSPRGTRLCKEGTCLFLLAQFAFLGFLVGLEI